MEQKVGKISEGIQATIELLESVPIRGKDLETTGLGILTAIKNLKIINEAVIKAERGETFEHPVGPEDVPEFEVVMEPAPAEEEGAAE